MSMRYEYCIPLGIQYTYPLPDCFIIIVHYVLTFDETKNLKLKHFTEAVKSIFWCSRNTLCLIKRSKVQLIDNLFVYHQHK